MNNTTSERLFIAIEFPKYVIDQLVAIQKKLEKLHLFEAKYIAPEQLHLTLKFIGEVDVSRKQKIQDVLRTIRYESFEGCFGNLGVLPSKKDIRILWIGFIADVLTELVKQIETVLEPIIQLEERPFLSHVTLARVKRVYDKYSLMKALSEIGIPNVCYKVTEFVIKKSELTNNGSIYYDIEHYSLL